MLMKFKFIVLIITLFASGFANSCSIPKIIDNGSVKIIPDGDKASGMYHVRVPNEYKGNAIEFLILSASVKSGNELHEIAMSLSIKSKNGLTGSHFHMSSRWANIRIAANYKDMPCTELVANLGM
jgi:hypothetical protein